MSKNQYKCHEISPDLQEIHNEQIQQAGKCPFKCGCLETNMECMSGIIVQSWQKAIKDLEERISKSGVCDVIRQLLTQGLKCKDTTVGPAYIPLTTGSFYTLVQEAFREQTHKGCTNIQRGFLSKHWEKAQKEYDRQQKNNQKTGIRCLLNGLSLAGRCGRQGKKNCMEQA